MAHCQSPVSFWVLAASYQLPIWLLSVPTSGMCREIHPRQSADSTISVILIQNPCLALRRYTNFGAHSTARVS